MRCAQQPMQRALALLIAGLGVLGVQGAAEAACPAPVPALFTATAAMAAVDGGETTNVGYRGTVAVVAAGSPSFWGADPALVAVFDSSAHGTARRRLGLRCDTDLRAATCRGSLALLQPPNTTDTIALELVTRSVALPSSTSAAAWPPLECTVATTGRLHLQSAAVLSSPVCLEATTASAPALMPLRVLRVPAAAVAQRVVGGPSAVLMQSESSPFDGPAPLTTAPVLGMAHADGNVVPPHGRYRTQSVPVVTAASPLSFFTAPDPAPFGAGAAVTLTGRGFTAGPVTAAIPALSQCSLRCAAVSDTEARCLLPVVKDVVPVVNLTTAGCGGGMARIDLSATCGEDARCAASTAHGLEAVVAAAALGDMAVSARSTSSVATAVFVVPHTGLYTFRCEGPGAVCFITARNVTVAPRSDGANGTVSLIEGGTARVTVAVPPSVAGRLSATVPVSGAALPLGPVVTAPLPAVPLVAAIAPMGCAVVAHVLRPVGTVQAVPVDLRGVALCAVAPTLAAALMDAGVPVPVSPRCVGARAPSAVPCCGSPNSTTEGAAGVVMGPSLVGPDTVRVVGLEGACVTVQTPPALGAWALDPLPAATLRAPSAGTVCLSVAVAGVPAQQPPLPLAAEPVLEEEAGPLLVRADISGAGGPHPVLAISGTRFPLNASHPLGPQISVWLAPPPGLGRPVLRCDRSVECDSAGTRCSCSVAAVPGGAVAAGLWTVGVAFATGPARAAPPSGTDVVLAVFPGVASVEGTAAAPTCGPAAALFTPPLLAFRGRGMPSSVGDAAAAGLRLWVGAAPCEVIATTPVLLHCLLPARADAATPGTPLPPTSPIVVDVGGAQSTVAFVTWGTGSSCSAPAADLAAPGPERLPCVATATSTLSGVSAALARQPTAAVPAPDLNRTTLRNVAAYLCAGTVPFTTVASNGTTAPLLYAALSAPPVCVECPWGDGPRCRVPAARLPAAATLTLVVQYAAASGTADFRWAEPSPLLAVPSTVAVGARVVGVVPTEASAAGGALLTITGFGFGADSASVAVAVTDRGLSASAWSCAVQTLVPESGEHPGVVVCRMASVPRGAPGPPQPTNVSITLRAAGEPTTTARCDAPTGCQVNLTLSAAPSLDSVSPRVLHDTILSTVGLEGEVAARAAATQLTLFGQGFRRNTTVAVHGARCAVAAMFDAFATCAVDPEAADGLVPGGAPAVTVTTGRLGDATTTRPFAAGVAPAPRLLSVDPTAGSTAGGQRVTLRGVALPTADRSSVAVSMSGARCAVVAANASTVVCVTSALGSESSASGAVVVEGRAAVPSRLSPMDDARSTPGRVRVECCLYTFDAAGTPRVTAVEPSRGVAAVRVTLLGAGFAAFGPFAVYFGPHRSPDAVLATDGIVAVVPDIAAASVAPSVVFERWGNAAVAGSYTVVPTFDVTVRSASAAPLASLLSFGGGGLVRLDGRALGGAGAVVSVTLCGQPCAVVEHTLRRVVCRAPSLLGAQALLAVQPNATGPLQRLTSSPRRRQEGPEPSMAEPPTNAAVLLDGLTSTGLEATAETAAVAVLRSPRLGAWSVGAVRVLLQGSASERCGVAVSALLGGSEVGTASRSVPCHGWAEVLMGFDGELLLASAVALRVTAVGPSASTIAAEAEVHGAPSVPPQGSGGGGACPLNLVVAVPALHSTVESCPPPALPGGCRTVSYATSATPVVTYATPRSFGRAPLLRFGNETAATSTLVRLLGWSLGTAGGDVAVALPGGWVCHGTSALTVELRCAAAAPALPLTAGTYANAASTDARRASGAVAWAAGVVPEDLSRAASAPGRLLVATAAGLAVTVPAPDGTAAAATLDTLLLAPGATVHVPARRVLRVSGTTPVMRALVIDGEVHLGQEGGAVLRAAVVIVRRGGTLCSDGGVANGVQLAPLQAVPPCHACAPAAGAVAAAIDGVLALHGALGGAMVAQQGAIVRLTAPSPPSLLYLAAAAVAGQRYVDLRGTVVGLSAGNTLGLSSPRAPEATEEVTVRVVNAPVGGFTRVQLTLPLGRAHGPALSAVRTVQAPPSSAPPGTLPSVVNASVAVGAVVVPLRRNFVIEALPSAPGPRPVVALHGEATLYGVSILGLGTDAAAAVTVVPVKTQCAPPALEPLPTSCTPGLTAKATFVRCTVEPSQGSAAVAVGPRAVAHMTDSALPLGVADGNATSRGLVVHTAADVTITGGVALGGHTAVAAAAASSLAVSRHAVLGAAHGYVVGGAASFAGCTVVQPRTVGFALTVGNVSAADLTVWATAEWWSAAPPSSWTGVSIAQSNATVWAAASILLTDVTVHLVGDAVPSAHVVRITAAPHGPVFTVGCQRCSLTAAASISVGSGASLFLDDGVLRAPVVFRRRAGLGSPSVRLGTILQLSPATPFALPEARCFSAVVALDPANSSAVLDGSRTSGPRGAALLSTCPQDLKAGCVAATEAGPLPGLWSRVAAGSAASVHWCVMDGAVTVDLAADGVVAPLVPSAALAFSSVVPETGRWQASLVLPCSTASTRAWSVGGLDNATALSIAVTPLHGSCVAAPQLTVDTNLPLRAPGHTFAVEGSNATRLAVSLDAAGVTSFTLPADAADAALADPWWGRSASAPHPLRATATPMSPQEAAVRTGAVGDVAGAVRVAGVLVVAGALSIAPGCDGPVEVVAASVHVTETGQLNLTAPSPACPVVLRSGTVTVDRGGVLHLEGHAPHPVPVSWSVTSVEARRLSLRCDSTAAAAIGATAESVASAIGQFAAVSNASLVLASPGSSSATSVALRVVAATAMAGGGVDATVTLEAPLAPDVVVGSVVGSPPLGVLSWRLPSVAWVSLEPHDDDGACRVDCDGCTLSWRHAHVRCGPSDTDAPLVHCRNATVCSVATSLVWAVGNIADGHGTSAAVELGGPAASLVASSVVVHAAGPWTDVVRCPAVCRVESAAVAVPYPSRTRGTIGAGCAMGVSSAATVVGSVLIAGAGWDGVCIRPQSLVVGGRWVGLQRCSALDGAGTAVLGGRAAVAVLAGARAQCGSGALLPGASATLRRYSASWAEVGLHAPRALAVNTSAVTALQATALTPPLLLVPAEEEEVVGAVPLSVGAVIAASCAAGIAVAAPASVTDASITGPAACSGALPPVGILTAAEVATEVPVLLPAAGSATAGDALTLDAVTFAGFGHGSCGFALSPPLASAAPGPPPVVRLGNVTLPPRALLVPSTPLLQAAASTLVDTACEPTDVGCSSVAQLLLLPTQGPDAGRAYLPAATAAFLCPAPLLPSALLGGFVSCGGGPEPVTELGWLSAVAEVGVQSPLQPQLAAARTATVGFGAPGSGRRPMMVAVEGQPSGNVTTASVAMRMLVPPLLRPVAGGAGTGGATPAPPTAVSDAIPPTVGLAPGTALRRVDLALRGCATAGTRAVVEVSVAEPDVSVSAATIAANGTLHWWSRLPAPLSPAASSTGAFAVVLTEPAEAGAAPVPSAVRLPLVCGGESVALFLLPPAVVAAVLPLPFDVVRAAAVDIARRVALFLTNPDTAAAAVRAGLAPLRTNAHSGGLTVRIVDAAPVPQHRGRTQCSMRLTAVPATAAFSAAAGLQQANAAAALFAAVSQRPPSAFVSNPSPTTAPPPDAAMAPLRALLAIYLDGAQPVTTSVAPAAVAFVPAASEADPTSPIPTLAYLGAIVVAAVALLIAAFVAAARITDKWRRPPPETGGIVPGAPLPDTTWHRGTALDDPAFRYPVWLLGAGTVLDECPPLFGDPAAQGSDHTGSSTSTADPDPGTRPHTPEAAAPGPAAAPAPMGRRRDQVPVLPPPEVHRSDPLFSHNVRRLIIDEGLLLGHEPEYDARHFVPAGSLLAGAVETVAASRYFVRAAIAAAHQSRAASGDGEGHEASPLLSGLDSEGLVAPPEVPVLSRCSTGTTAGADTEPEAAAALLIGRKAPPTSAGAVAAAAAFARRMQATLKAPGPGRSSGLEPT